MLSVDHDLYMRHPGGTVVVLGTSGSLLETDLAGLKGLPIIGANDALGASVYFNLDFFASYLVLVDFRALERAIDDIIEHPEVMIITTSHLAQGIRAGGARNPICEMTLMPGETDRLTGPVRQTNNTGHYCTQLAARMVRPGGRVVLAGIDLRYPTDAERAAGKVDHYWGDGAKDGCRQSFDPVVAEFRQSARWTNLYTLSPWQGPLTEFLPRISVEEIKKK